jgi:hypothetical protein
MVEIKVITVGKNFKADKTSLLIALPKVWVQRNKIKAKDQLQILSDQNADGDLLIIRKKKG